MKFIIIKFEDKLRYCRAPIYLGGELQIHIMQPYDDKECEAGPEPKTDREWYKLIKKHGQIVISLEALPDFINALQKFAETLKKTNKSENKST